MKQADILQRHPKLQLENGKIESVSLSIADHGVLSGWVMVGMNGSGCGFGGYCLGKLDEPWSSDERKHYAAAFVIRTMQVVGVLAWEDLKGQPIRVLSEGLGGGILAIGNFIKDEWFCPKEEWKK